MFAVLLAVLLIAFCWFFGHLSLLSTSLLILTDSVAHAFQWVGVTDPGLAWLLLGVVAGGLIGAFVGMRRAGRAVPRRHVRNIAVVVGGALLVGGSYPPSGVAVAADRPSRPRPVSAAGRVAPGRTRSPRTRVAGVPERLDPSAAATPAYASGGEVQLGPDASAASLRGPHVVPPDSDRVHLTADPASPSTTPAVQPSGGDAPDEAADRSLVAGVQTRLSEARNGADAGDFPAALRALAAADEGVTLGAAKYGDAAWIASLRREAVSARGTVRATCQTAAAAATRRGDPAPRCE